MTYGTKHCGYCGKEYLPKKADRDKYCSRECAFKSPEKRRKWRDAIRKGQEASAKKAREESKRKALLRRLRAILNNLWECKHCGKKIYKKQYCSPECNKAYKKAMNTRHNLICTDCGEVFHSHNPRKLYCSDKCRKHAENYRHEVRRRHLLMRNGRVDYSITLGKLIKRDNGICHICGKRVDTRANHNSNEYPSIDHVMPIAMGGTHTWNNVALAHRGCNNLKSSSMAYEGANGQLRLAM